MYNDNLFDILISVVFVISPQIGGLGPKTQDIVILFRLCKEETLPDFYLEALTIRSELDLMQYQRGQINNLIGKYII